MMKGILRTTDREEALVASRFPVGFQFHLVLESRVHSFCLFVFNERTPCIFIVNDHFVQNTLMTLQDNLELKSL